MRKEKKKKHSIVNKFFNDGMYRTQENITKGLPLCPFDENGELLKVFFGIYITES